MYLFQNVLLQHAPGIPKILIGNRLHLAFKRQVSEGTAESYARKHSMVFFEVSPLCNYNITESFVELSRMALLRNGMERLWRSNRGKYQCLSLVLNYKVDFMHKVHTNESDIAVIALPV